MTLLSLKRRIVRDTRAVSMVEFALVLPVFTLLMLSGVEVTNYVTTKMRISQIALHLADHISRLGTGSQLAAKTISETQINDVLTGSGVQAGTLNLFTSGRVIISSVEKDNVNSGVGVGNRKVKIAWQRCRGSNAHVSAYGNTGDANKTGIGPTGQQVGVPGDDYQTIFVEVYYVYRPIIATRYAPSTIIQEVASMPVRDRRDTSQIYNTENATIHVCSAFTST